jgi:hypothetical protein
VSAKRWGIGALLAMGAAGAVAGIVFWGGFNTAMEATNSMEFCISCHEMKDNVYQEYKKSPHYKNASGVRAICSDCHVPKEWGPKVWRKIQASNELYHHLRGTIDTPEKFDAKRAETGRARVGNDDRQRLARMPQLPQLGRDGPPEADAARCREDAGRAEGGQDLHRMPQGCGSRAAQARRLIKGPLPLATRRG